MADRPVMLQVPDYVYDRASRIGQEIAQSVEVVLFCQLVDSFSDSLRTLPSDEQAGLATLQSLSDNTLWMIAAERTLPFQQERLSLLLALNKRGLLSDAEQVELDDLIQRGDRLTPRKAEATALLTHRGC